MNSPSLRLHPIDYVRRLHPLRRIEDSVRAARLRHVARQWSAHLAVEVREEDEQYTVVAVLPGV